PSHDLLIVRSDGDEVMVPFVSAIVPEVDLAAGRVTVTPPAGLFEELPDDAAAAPETPDDAPEAPDADGPADDRAV
ncbi:MAG: ribosome maturation factor RimM, partial [Microbacterium sp.]